jgi:hypothetical protein
MPPGMRRENWLCHLRETHIPDFSHWTNPTAYQREFDRLFKALRSA